MKSLLVASALTLLLAPRAALACSPPAPSLQSTTPANGETYPANAPILLSGTGLQLDQIKATIDGVEATVQQSGYRLTLSPTPKPGQKVQLDGPVCSWDGAQCKLALGYTAGPDDLTAPGAVQSVSFDVFDYADFKSSGGDCQSDSDFAVYISVQGTDGPTETPNYWNVALVDPANSSQPLATRTIPRSDNSGKISLELLLSQFPGAKLPGGFCVQVSSSDVVGNTTDAVQACSPCHFRQDSSQPGFSSPPEPAWTPADVVAGGACDPGAGGSGGSGQGGAAGQAGAAGQGGSAAGSGGSGQGGTAGAGAAGSSGTSGQAGSAGSGPAVEGTDSGDEGGCSTSGRASSGWSALGLLGLAALAARSRRQR